MSEKRSEEMIFIRVIACLSIVLLHSIEEFRKRVSDIDNYKTLAETIVVILKFGTPAFVFISIFLLAYNYKKSLPVGFFQKRIKYILIPYVSMAFFFGIVFHIYGTENRSVKSYTFHNLFYGGYHGYFLLIIFQFFALYWLWTKYPIGYKKLLSFSFLINILYLAVFNLVDSPKFTPFLDISGDLLWYRLSWIPFPGWLAYFAVAVWMGNNYEQIQRFLVSHKIAVLTAPIITGALVACLYNFDVITLNSSKRIDMIPFTLSMILALLYLFKDRKASRIWLVINNYSFSIYFLHVFYVVVLTDLCARFKITNFTIIAALFVASTVLSIWSSWLLNKFSFGKYIVGRVNTIKSKKSNRKITRTSYESA
ncbi:acyltransferase family protein [Paenibacillus sp. sptzw28]|uniref:acyltransferase family protein n=1 Tax=Paenibacillus sp. sptzw28 TaxID=715179 RepID=UPI001C6E22A9|nr:acyltransferase family protein [Paenibacillus sp. sptzw28]QYR23118.1 acyltransferase family protein [Paenibacillus sp. sptzw28]